MKKIKLFLVAAALTGGMALLSSCGNDDNVAEAILPDTQGSEVEITSLNSNIFQFEMPEGDYEIEIEYYE